MGSSYVGSLNALVSSLDEWNMLSRFSEEKAKEDILRDLSRALPNVIE
jgi:hypothetical protein